MKKIISLGFAFASLSVTAFPADRHIAFERNNAVYFANLDGTNEKKIADGIFLRSRLTELALHLTPSRKLATRLTCGTWPW